MKLDTKRIGNATELELMLAFTKQGCPVLTPYGDDERYDLVADIKGALIRIQAKTSSPIDEGRAFEFDCRRNIYERGKKVKREPYYDDDFDYFGTVWNGQCYLVPLSECKRCKRLRLEPSASNRGMRSVWATDYELEKIVAEIEHELEEEDLNERTYKDTQKNNGLGVVG